DLAHTRAGEWALSAFFPPELRGLFVDCLGVREVVSRETLFEGHRQEGRHRRARDDRAAAPAAGFHRERSVNESGLPDDLLAGCPWEGRAGRGGRGVSLQDG
ncbi:unnamed protein product, partial [Prorocentrum cordatum]